MTKAIILKEKIYSEFVLAPCKDDPLNLATLHYFWIEGTETLESDEGDLSPRVARVY